jgi:protein SCO1/2
VALKAAALCCLVVLAAGCGGHVAAPSTMLPAKGDMLAGAAVPKGTTAQDFTLRDQNGETIGLSALRGRLVLLAFLYTQCTDVCPVIARNLSTAVQALGHEATSVRVLAVSVDPQSDTPSAARTYVRTHRLVPQFHWLLGTRTQLAPVWQAYNVLVEERNPERVAHAAPIFLIDRSGAVRAFYGERVRASDVEHDLQTLLRDGG